MQEFRTWRKAKEKGREGLFPNTGTAGVEAGRFIPYAGGYSHRLLYSLLRAR